jgi:uncharacterized protein
LMTKDVPAAKAFYARVMGWVTLNALTPGVPYILFTVDKIAVSGLMGLSEDARKMGATPSWIGYVGVDDVDATADRFTRLGGAVRVPPTDILAVSRFAIVADPQMAELALVRWLRPEQHPPAEPGKPGRVGWHELFAADREKAFAFYHALFAWQKADADNGPLGTYQQFSAGGQTIGGIFTKPATMPVPFWLYYFNVGDIDAAAGRVKAAGGQVLDGPREVPGGHWIAQCMDPQGAMFALSGKRSKDAVGFFAPAAAPRRGGG